MAVNGTGDDATITDNLTGLIWIKDANLMTRRDPTFDQDGTVNDGLVTWENALDYIVKLKNEKYLECNTWRLPNADIYRKNIL